MRFFDDQFLGACGDELSRLGGRLLLGGSVFGRHPRPVFLGRLEVVIVPRQAWLKLISGQEVTLACIGIARYN